MDNELSLEEKYRLLGWLDNRELEDFDEDLFHRIYNVEIPDLMNIEQRKRRAITLYLHAVLREFFGDDLEQEEQFSNAIVGMALRILLEGYAYRDAGYRL